MHIGVLSIELHFPGSQNLKQKRRILKSLCERLRNQFNIAIAEVDGNDFWQRGRIGITSVSNESLPLDRLFTAITSFVADNQGDYQVIDSAHEVMAFNIEGQL